MRHQVFWAGSIGALAAYDYACSKRANGSTLSEILRAGLTTHERQGLFVMGWLALTAWFLPHILVPALDELAHENCPVCNRTRISNRTSRAPITGA